MLILMICWYSLGLLGCGLASYVDIKRGEDFTLSDLLISLFMSIFGFLVFACAVGHAIKYNPMKPIVLIKGKK